MCEAEVIEGASFTVGAANLHPPASAFRVSPFAMNFTVTSTAVSAAEQGAAILVACACCVFRWQEQSRPEGADKAWCVNAARSSPPINLLCSV
jgi:hypothetical protein